MRRGTLIVYVRRDDATDHSPLVPGSWHRTFETGRLTTIYPRGREGYTEIMGVDRPNADIHFHCWEMVRHPTLPRAVYVCVGHPWILQYLADRIVADALAWTLFWPDLPTLRADARPGVVALRDAWIDERPEGDAGERVRLFHRVAGFADDDAEA